MTSPIVSGSFTSTGSVMTIPMSMEVDGIFLFNRTDMNSTATPGVVKKAMWLSSMAQNSAFLTKNTDGAATDESSIITTGGISRVDQNNPAVYAQVALGAPFNSAANPTVWTTATSHGFAVGDLVRIYGTTGELEFAGLDFTVSAVGSATTFTTLISTVGRTPPTAGFVRKLSFEESFYYPKNRFIASMTSSGVSTVVVTTVAHGYKVGQKVVFKVPAITATAFGMTAMDGLVGTVTAIDTTVTVNSFTVDIDSSSFGSFVYPVTGDYPFTFAQVVPYSDGQPNPLNIPAPESNVLVGARDNRAVRGIQIGTSILTAADKVWDYYAFSSAQIINP